MSSLEMNKIAGAVLTAGVIAMLAGFVAKKLTLPHELEQNVYVVAAVDDGGTTAEAPADTGPEPVLPLLASADPAAGEKVAKKCTACHTFEQGGANKIGPNLWNIVNGAAGAVDGFNYSGAIEDLGGAPWSYEALNGFLADPKGYAPGTKMTFAGIRKVGDRAALIAYMRSMSDSPAPMPTEEEIAAVQATAAAEDAPAEAEAPAETAGEEAAGEETTGTAAAGDAAAAGNAPEVLALLAAADAEAGRKVARKCTACHTFDQGGKNKIGPNLYNVIGRPIAAMDGFRFSDALQSKSGETWTYENLDGFLTSPKTWAPGNKMTFAGLRKVDDRAALIAYLREQSDSPPALPE